MDEEINFCPFCDAPQHKIMGIKEDLMFCKECNKFFTFEPKEFNCPKCNSEKITNSDFPTPTGEMVFQCQKCRKMFPAAEFFKKQG